MTTTQTASRACSPTARRKRCRLQPWSRCSGRRCERTPDRAAVVGSDCSLTYAELHAQANQLAQSPRRTRRRAPVRHVGVFLDRTCAEIVAILAALKAGAALRPAAHRPSRRRGWSSSSPTPRSACVLTTTELGARAANGRPELSRSTRRPPPISPRPARSRRRGRLAYSSTRRARRVRQGRRGDTSRPRPTTPRSSCAGSRSAGPRCMSAS